MNSDIFQAIKDAEDQLEIAKIDYERSKDKIRQLKLKKQEKQKEEIQADGLELPGVQINIRELHEVLFRDVGNKIKDSGKWVIPVHYCWMLVNITLQVKNLHYEYIWAHDYEWWDIHFIDEWVYKVMRNS